MPVCLARVGQHSIGRRLGVGDVEIAVRQRRDDHWYRRRRYHLGVAAGQGHLRLHLRPDLRRRRRGKVDAGQPELDDIVRAQAGPRRLLPAQRLLAERADQAAQPPDVRHVHLVRHPAGLVRADVQVRAREDPGHAGQDLLHQLEGRAQLRVEPHGAAAVAGQELVLDLVPAGSQVRPQPQQRGGVPGRVDLGNDRDEAVRGVAGEVAEVFVAVAGCAGLRAGRRAAQGERPGLVVGQVQV